eukprot:1889361-Ditylum_brightwellii.AAC.1
MPVSAESSIVYSLVAYVFGSSAPIESIDKAASFVVGIESKTASSKTEVWHRQPPFCRTSHFP